MDTYVSLTGFELDGTVISATSKSTSTKKTYTVQLDALSTTAQKLTFKAASDRPGTRTIVTKAKYLQSTSCGGEQTGQLLTMVIPSQSGTPMISLVSSSFVDTEDKNITIYDNNLDGITPNTIKTIHENSGNGEAWDLSATVGLLSLGYIDIDKISFQVEGGEKENLNKDECIIERTNLSETTAYKYMNYGDNENNPFQIKIKFPSYVTVAPGKKITLWVQTYNGKVYDNKDKDVYASSVGAALNACSVNYTCNDSQGEPGGKQTNTRVISGFASPKFAVLPDGFTLKSNQSITQKILFSAPSINEKSKFRITVKLPEWMALDYENGIEEAILFKNVAETLYEPMANTAKYENGVYSIIFSTTAVSATQEPQHYLWLNYKITGSLEEDEKERKGTIQYGLDYIINGYYLENISQVKQPVSFIKEEGIRLDKFSLQRTTKGLKDSNNKRKPDDGTIAPDEEINSYLYISEDEGMLKWEATVLDGTYKYLYLPFTTGANINLESKEAPGKVNFNSEKINIKVDNSSVPEEMISINKIDDNSFYILLQDAESKYLKEGNEIKVSVPFKEKLYSAFNTFFKGKCFVSNVAINKPGESNANPDRKGKDFVSHEVRFVYPQLYFYWNNDQHYSNFYNDEEISMAGGWQNIFHNVLASPYFGNEYRCHQYPYQMTWEMPEGYTLVGGMTVTRGSGDTEGPATQTIYPDPNLSSGNVYVFDMESLYDLDYDGSPGKPLKDGKWILPDDRWYQNNTVTIKPSKAAAPVSTLKRSYLTKNPKTGLTTPLSRSVTFNYQGTTISIEPSVKKLTAYSTKVNIPNINLANTSGEDFIHHLWLYVDGNVNNLELKGSGITAKGQGFEKRWIKLTDKMIGGTAMDFSLDFDFNGTDEDITIYTICGFDNEKWPEPDDEKLNTSANPNLGAKTSIRVTMADASLTGTLKVSDPNIDHLQPYTVTITVDGRQSEGLLRNPKVSLTIPEGQHYIPGSATFKYDNKSGLSALLDEALKTGNDDSRQPAPLPSERTIVLDLSQIAGQEIVFPGFLSSDPSDTDAKRVAVIEAEFDPMCNSELTSMRFTGMISGENARGVAAATYKIISPSLLPAMPTDYDFDVNATLSNTSHAFNEWQLSDVLTVTLRKITGADIPMQSSDYFLLEMPAQMNINGNISQSSVISGIAGNATIESNAVSPSGDKRSIRIALPIDEINQDGSLGQNKDIVFTMSVVYSPDEKELANDPLHRIEAKVVSSAQFGSCGKKSITVGESVVDIAILTIDKMDYTTFIGTPLTLKILDNSLKGKWYTDESLSDEVAEGASFTYTPEPTEYPDKNALANGVEKTFWVSALFPDADDPQIINDYGKVPVKITVYPTLAFETLPQNTVCGSGNRAYNELINETTVPVGTDVALYTTESCTDGSKITTWPYPISSSHSIWACASNKGGKGTPKEIQFTVYEAPEIGTDLVEETVYLDNGGKTTLAISATGDNIRYEWYKRAVGEHTFDVVADHNLPTLEVSESGEYYVLVIGCEMKQSKTTTIVICPPLSIAIDETMPVTYCETSQALIDGIRLKDYIKDMNPEFDYLYLNESVYEKITDDIYLSKQPGETTYSLIAENKAGSRTQPLRLKITIDRIISITDHPKDIQVYSGRSATLSVTALGDNLTYQWQEKGADSQFADIDGATEREYSISQAGEYRVVVTGNTSGCGNQRIESQSAKVTVYTPPVVEEVLCRVTYEANWSSVVTVKTYSGNITLGSGDYVDQRTRVVVTATPGMAGLNLVSLTANDRNISNGDIIAIDTDTHIIATFELGNTDPNPDPVNNQEALQAIEIWSARGSIYIRCNSEERIRIYDPSGRIKFDQQIPAGETSLELPKGVYVVVMNEGIVKKIVVKD